MPDYNKTESIYYYFRKSVLLQIFTLIIISQPLPAFAEQSHELVITDKLDHLNKRQLVTALFIAAPYTDEFFVRCILVTRRSSESEIIATRWLLNGQQIPDEPQTQYFKSTKIYQAFESIGNGLGTLIFYNIPPSLNGTTVSCLAKLSGSREERLSPPSTILFEPPLEAVGHLHLHLQAAESLYLLTDDATPALVRRMMSFPSEKIKIEAAWTAPFTFYPESLQYCTSVNGAAESCQITPPEYSFEVSAADLVCITQNLTVAAKNWVGDRGVVSSATLHLDDMERLPVGIVTGIEVDEEKGTLYRASVDLPDTIVDKVRAILLVRCPHETSDIDTGTLKHIPSVSLSGDGWAVITAKDYVSLSQYNVVLIYGEESTTSEPVITETEQMTRNLSFSGYNSRGSDSNLDIIFYSFDSFDSQRTMNSGINTIPVYHYIFMLAAGISAFMK